MARLGGDEFALVLEELESPQGTLKPGEKLDSSLAEPYALRVHGKTIAVRISASNGMAAYLANEDAGGDEKLMHVADDATYIAKRTGKNRGVHAARVRRMLSPRHRCGPFARTLKPRGQRGVHAAGA